MRRQAIYSHAIDLVDLVERGRVWNFHDADTTEHLHFLHPYPARFIPQIPRKAICEYTAAGDLVYDPFCGCGTTLLEASLMGRPSVGTDNNEVAVLVSRAKLARYSKHDVGTLGRFCDQTYPLFAYDDPAPDLEPKDPAFRRWFSADVIPRLSSLKRAILSVGEPARTMLLAVFSSIIVRVSKQDSDTRYASVARSVNPDDVHKLFRERLLEVVKRLATMTTEHRETSAVFLHDARDVPFIRDSSVSLIVTSPPYLNAYDYHKYHRQRLHWLDGDIALARDVEIGKHDEFTRPRAKPDRYFADMDKCFAEWHRVTKRRGHCLVVVGDAIVSKAPVAVADEFVRRLAIRGFVLRERWIRELKSTSRAFNVSNARVTHEHVLLLQRT